MNAYIIRGRDRHTVRLEAGLRSCGITMNPNQAADLLFLDPSSEVTQIPLGVKYRMFFDTEDDPRHFDPGPMYYRNKNIIKHYAKMNYYDDDDRKDGIKNIGFPLDCFLRLKDIANYNSEYKEENIKPYLIASPTFLGKYEPELLGHYNQDDNTSCLGRHELGHWMYNQRIDWLLSLIRSHINYYGGLVFSHDNLSVEWQSRYFGNVSKLKTYPIPYNQNIYNMFKHKICLCPTGHDRLSWRTYDIMATGGILISTDRKKQLALINPKEYITIYDGEDLGIRLQMLQPEYKEIWKLHQANREIFKTLTPEKLLTLFLNQLE